MKKKAEQENPALSSFLFAFSGLGSCGKRNALLLAFSFSLSLPLHV